MWLWLIRLAIVLVFVIMVVWRGTAAWGVGLLTATAVVLLDALRVRGALDESGFFAPFLSGLIAAGAFTWLAALLRPFMGEEKIAPTRSRPTTAAARDGDAAIDRQMLFEQMRTNLGPDDVLDLIFDLGLYENQIINPAQAMPDNLTTLIDVAAQEGKLDSLAQGVERILTPLPPERLPRLERLSAETPPHLLRQYLIANYNLTQLANLATRIDVDPGELGSDAKTARVRRLLLYLRRRQRLGDLIAAMQAAVTPTG